MLVLPNTTDKIQVVLGEAIVTSNPTVSAFWRDVTSTDRTPGSTHTAANGVTAVDVVAAPAASTGRLVETLSVHQKDTVGHNVTVQIDISGTKYVLWSGRMVPGSFLQYAEGKGFRYSAESGAGYILPCYALASGLAASNAHLTMGLDTTGAGSAFKAYTAIVPKNGTIKRAYVFVCAPGGAGTNEAWSAYLIQGIDRITIGYMPIALLATVSAATVVREFINNALNLPVCEGDRVGVVFAPAGWATAPLSPTFGGYLYIE